MKRIYETKERDLLKALDHIDTFVEKMEHFMNRRDDYNYKVLIDKEGEDYKITFHVFKSQVKYDKLYGE